MKPIEALARDIAQNYGADEILDALAEAFRLESYETRRPLSDRLSVAASVTLGAAAQIRENWKRFDKRSAS